MYTLWLGFRNTVRNKRRSILIMIALIISYVVLVFGIGWVRGYFSTIFKNINDFDTAHIQVYHPDYLKDKPRIPMEYAVQNYAQLRKKLASLDSVAEVSGRIDIPASISYKGKKLYTILRAIDPGYEQNITRIKKVITDGKYFDSQAGLILGKGLAKKLGVSVGDMIILTIRNKYRVDDIMPLRLLGTFEFGYPAMDDNMVYADIETIQQLTGLDNAVINLVIRKKENISQEKALAEIQKSIADTPYRAYPWQDFAKALVQAVKTDSGSFVVFAIILFILTAANIVNAFSMSVQERIKELATLRAIGMKQGTLKNMILAESSALALLSSATGFILSLGIVWYISTKGINIAKYLPENMPMPFGRRFYGDYRWYDFISSAAVVIIISILGSISPARRAAKLIIADAMRETR
ncbi:FtsX-like permease family protein [Spirochaetia bacterium 38H-sp]|uniref:FtsX-like permease family protein n=1 Tax=Rarispira pelagica TaxID=3141764 RepID=A0ABU9U945_9SPIR